jgi:hypothetical protein
MTPDEIAAEAHGELDMFALGGVETVRRWLDAGGDPSAADSLFVVACTGHCDGYVFLGALVFVELQ